VQDPGYSAGLREAVTAGVGFGLEGVEVGLRDQCLSTATLPGKLVVQARLAARNRVPLDTVLRRYCACYTLFGDFIVRAAEEVDAPPLVLSETLRQTATVFDHLIASISEEYNREQGARARTTAERRLDQVRTLLAGEARDAGELNYDLELWHTALLATGPQSRTAVKELAGRLDQRLLMVCLDENLVWAWLGGQSALLSRAVIDAADESWPGGHTLVVGEPCEGVEGWRLSHRQAVAALEIAKLEQIERAAYADVALVSGVLHDDVLVASLSRIFLGPLQVERDEGRTLRRTLRAYFDAERNVSSAAIRLGVSRRTVANRLRRVEEHLDRRLDSCSPELEIALRLGFPNCAS